MINHHWKEVTPLTLKVVFLQYHLNGFKPLTAVLPRVRAQRQDLAQPELRNKQPADPRADRDIQTNKDQI
tara:strand:- start:486 stop:695 length:210 start_codon:yes stop_codon:yes gene_type:complete